MSSMPVPNVSDAFLLWSNVSEGLHAVQEFAKLVQVLGTSWQVLQKVLGRSQQKELRAASLRKELLVIYRQLREAHFAIGEHGLLPTNDFLAMELSAVLQVVEKACAAEPQRFQLEVVLDRAAFMQERVTDKLLALLPSGTSIEAADVENGPLRRVLADLLARSLVVEEALQTTVMAHPSLDDTSKCICREQNAPGSSTWLDYDTAAEDESDWGKTSTCESDDAGYTSCEDANMTSDAENTGRHSLAIAFCQRSCRRMASDSDSDSA
jgi:hypothetical protein